MRSTAWCAAVLGLAASAATYSAPPATHTVIIANVQFNPAQITVHRGERIVWKNQDLFPHTVTGMGKALDSGTIVPESSWTFRATKIGTFEYVCTLHPSMKGTVIVVK